MMDNFIYFQIAYVSVVGLAVWLLYKASMAAARWAAARYGDQWGGYVLTAISVALIAAKELTKYLLG